jgi:hypothetical protein
MGSIISRINDRIDEFGSLEAYLEFLEDKVKGTKVGSEGTNTHDIDVLNTSVINSNEREVAT